MFSFHAHNYALDSHPCGYINHSLSPLPLLFFSLGLSPLVPPSALYWPHKCKIMFILYAYNGQFELCPVSPSYKQKLLT